MQRNSFSRVCTVVAILHNTTTSWHTLVRNESSSNFDRIRKKNNCKNLSGTHLPYTKVAKLFLLS